MLICSVIWKRLEYTASQCEISIFFVSEQQEIMAAIPKGTSEMAFEHSTMTAMGSRFKIQCIRRQAANKDLESGLRGLQARPICECSGHRMSFLMGHGDMMGPLCCFRLRGKNAMPLCVMESIQIGLE